MRIEDDFSSSDSLTDMALDSELSDHERGLEGVDSVPFIQQTTDLLTETGLSDNLTDIEITDESGFQSAGAQSNQSSSQLIRFNSGSKNSYMHNNKRAIVN